MPFRSLRKLSARLRVNSGLRKPRFNAETPRRGGATTGSSPTLHLSDSALNSRRSGATSDDSTILGVPRHRLHGLAGIPQIRVPLFRDNGTGDPPVPVPVPVCVPEPGRPTGHGNGHGHGHDRPPKTIRRLRRCRRCENNRPNLRMVTPVRPTSPGRKGFDGAEYGFATAGTEEDYTVREDDDTMRSGGGRTRGEG